MPAGATGALEDGGGRHVPIQRLMDDSSAPAFARAPSCRKLPLPPGGRVTIAISPSAPMTSGYRAAPPVEGGEPAKIVFELARVNAGRAVGRGLSLRGAGRLLGAMAVSAAAVLGALGALAAAPPVDEDALDADRTYAMLRTLAAIAEREGADEEQAYAIPGEAIPYGDLRTGPSPPGPLGTRIGPHGRYLPISSLDEGTLLAFSSMLPWICGGILNPDAGDIRMGDQTFTQFGYPIELRCAAPRSDPIWLQGIGEPLLAPGEGPTRLWRLSYELAAASRAGLSVDPTVAGVLRVSRLRADGQVSVEAVDQRLRARLHAVKLCYGLHRAGDPSPSVPLDVRLRLGVDGRAWAELAPGADAEGLIAGCVLRAIDGLEVPAPKGKAASVDYRLQLEPPRMPVTALLVGFSGW